MCVCVGNIYSFRHKLIPAAFFFILSKTLSLNLSIFSSFTASRTLLAKMQILADLPPPELQTDLSKPKLNVTHFIPCTYYARLKALVRLYLYSLTTAMSAETSLLEQYLTQEKGKFSFRLTTCSVWNQQRG